MKHVEDVSDGSITYRKRQPRRGGYHCPPETRVPCGEALQRGALQRPSALFQHRTLPQIRGQLPRIQLQRELQNDGVRHRPTRPPSRGQEHEIILRPPQSQAEREILVPRPPAEVQGQGGNHGLHRPGPLVQGAEGRDRGGRSHKRIPRDVQHPLQEDVLHNPETHPACPRIQGDEVHTPPPRGGVQGGVRLRRELHQTRAGVRRRIHVHRHGRGQPHGMRCLLKWRVPSVPYRRETTEEH